MKESFSFSFAPLSVFSSVASVPTQHSGLILLPEPLLPRPQRRLNRLPLSLSLPLSLARSLPLSIGPYARSSLLFRFGVNVSIYPSIHLSTWLVGEQNHILSLYLYDPWTAWIQQGSVEALTLQEVYICAAWSPRRSTSCEYSDLTLKDSIWEITASHAVCGALMTLLKPVPCKRSETSLSASRSCRTTTHTAASSAIDKTWTAGSLLLNSNAPQFISTSIRCVGSVMDRVTRLA